jgi:propionyl-CoA carboxylase beta chain
MENAADLESMRLAALLGGGEVRIASQHEKGKLTARERIELLLDEGSFEEFDKFRQHDCNSFGMNDRKPLGDGVVAGCGTVNGRLVFVFSQDITVFSGSMSQAHAEKVCRLMDQAIRVGAPVVGLYDSCGARIEEGTAAFAGYAEIAKHSTIASGVVPQISLIMGPCVGAAAYIPAITDLIFMVNDTSYMFVNGPAVVKAVTNEVVTEEELGGAVTHACKSGVADLAFENDIESLLQLRRFLDFLPANNRENPPGRPCTDPVDREEISLTTLVPEDPRKPYDMNELILKIVDEGDFFELQSEFARNILIGFGRMNGSTVGFVANQPMILAGCLDVDSAKKAARFVRFCDCFNIPIVTLVDVPGFIPGTAQEHGGLIKHGAKLLFAYGEATVPKVTVVTRRAYGGAYGMMGSKHLRGDVNYAWPSSEIAAIAPNVAVKLLFRSETMDKAEIETRVEDYRQKFASPFHASSCGYIDDVIEPQSSRPHLCKALGRLHRKQLEDPWRKHSNIPL